MARKANTKANRTAERKSNRSQAASRNKERQQASRNAFDVLEQDHQEVEQWFDEYDELKDSDDDRKAELAEKICLALKVHAQIEEEIFYPAVKAALKDDELIPERPRISSAGLSFALAHSVRKPATPIYAMSSAPDNMASLITFPPSSTR